MSESPAPPRPQRRVNFAALLARLKPELRIKLGRGALPPTVRRSKRWVAESSRD